MSRTNKGDAVRSNGSRAVDEVVDERGTDAASRAADGGEVDVDVVVVGAGFAGMYLLHRLRGLGFTAVVIEAGGDVGGTWYWNRYPGARCDIQSLDYSYSFDPELDETWTWSEKYAAQPEILRYAQHVADKHDLRRDIRFSTRVEGAVWDDERATWRVRTSAGDEITCRFYVMATGCLSMPKEVDIEGTERFQGEVYFTSRWPHEGVDLTGRRVAVIGTGSSAIQSIPVMAAQAAQLTVFQRTPNFSIPANNGPVPDSKRAALERDRAAYRESARWSRGGVPLEVSQLSALAVSDEERLARYEEAWRVGGIIEFLGCYSDHLVSPQANEPPGRVRAQQDQGHRARPGDGRGAVPDDVPHRHQAPLRRHELLRDLQPPPRPPRRPPRPPDLDHHRDRHRPRGRVHRVRRHRLRHGLRRDDGRHRRRRHRGPRRPQPRARRGPTDRPPTSA